MTDTARVLSGGTGMGMRYHKPIEICISPNRMRTEVPPMPKAVMSNGKSGPKPLNALANCCGRSERAGRSGSSGDEQYYSSKESSENGGKLRRYPYQAQAPYLPYPTGRALLLGHNDLVGS